MLQFSYGGGPQTIVCPGHDTFVQAFVSHWDELHPKPGPHWDENETHWDELSQLTQWLQVFLLHIGMQSSQWPEPLG